MKVKAECEKFGLKLNIQKLKMMANHFMASRWGNNGNRDRLFSWAPKSLWMLTAAMKLKDACSLGKKSYNKPRLCIKKHIHYFANKRLFSQRYGFSSVRAGP